MIEWQTVAAEPAGMPAEVEERLKDPRWSFRDYVLIRQIGEGPIARVFRAWRRETGQFVALKLLRSDRVTPPMIERFVAEVRAASRLRHPNVVRIHRVGTCGGTTFLDSEFVDGESLQVRLQRGEPFAQGAALRLVMQAARAVVAAHAAGLVHGDLKPSNVLVDGSRAKVADFGMWRVREDVREANEAAADVRSLGTLLGRLLGSCGPDLGRFVREACEGRLSSGAFLDALERRLAGIEPSPAR